MTNLPSLIFLEVAIQMQAGPFTAIKAVLDTGSQITALTAPLAKKLNFKLTATQKTVPLSNGTIALGEYPVFQANLMFKTRDGGTSILDGFEVVLLPQGDHAVIGLDCLSKFSYRIADGVTYLLKDKAS